MKVGVVCEGVYCKVGCVRVYIVKVGIVCEGVYCEGGYSV